MDNNNGMLKSFISGEAVFGFWKIVSKFFSLANSFLIIGFLSVADYGVVILLSSSYAIINSLVPTFDEVVNNDLIRYRKSGQLDKCKKLYWEFFLLKFCGGIFLNIAVFVLGLILIYLGRRDSGIILLVFSFLFSISGIYESIKMLFLSNNEFTIVANRSSYYQAIRLFLMLAVINFIGLSLIVVVAAQVIANLVVLVLFIPKFISRLGEVRQWPKYHGHVLPGIVRGYGKWQLFKSWLNNFSNNIRPWLIKFFISTEAVGLFGFATSLIGVMKFVFPMNTISYIIPASAHDMKKLNKAFNYSLKYLVFFSIILVFFSVSVSPIIVGIFFNKFKPALPFFWVMSLSFPLYIFQNILNNFFVALRKQKFLFLRAVAENSISISLTMLLILLLGSWGMVAEYLITPLVMIVLTYLYLLRVNPGVSFDSSQLLSFNGTDRMIWRSLWHEMKIFFHRLSNKFGYRKS